ncbi:MAG: LacI family DNA-binding transcriptional regulator [Bacteroidota bacterium]
MSRTTLKDVAQEAEVSIATVSAVVNDADWVSDGTRARVRTTIESMGYRPNRVARSLKTRRGDAVGVIVSDLTNPFFTEVVRGLQHGLRERGLSLLLADADHRFDLGGAQLDVLLDKQVDGLVVIGDSVPEAALAPHLRRAGRVPVVAIERTYDADGVHALVVDSERAGYEATRHLVARGYSHVGHVTGPLDGPGSTTHGRVPRLEGWRRALAEAGLAHDDRLVAPGNWRIDGGHAAAAHLLALPEPPDALFCANDMMALGAMAAAREAGLSLPRDLAVVGFDDVPVAALVDPALTTMAMPKADLGRAAAALVRRLVEGGDDAGPALRSFPARLVIRASTPPKR